MTVHDALETLSTVSRNTQAWQEFRKHESPVPDLEEVRRRAREDWRKKIQ
jgi:hypothetical protein